MIKNRIYHIICLGLLLGFGFAAKSMATSIIPGYQAAHYGKSTWIITQVYEHTIDPKEAAILHFEDGVVFVEQGCHSFSVMPPEPDSQSKTRLVASNDQPLCPIITPLQGVMMDIYQHFEMYTPLGDDSFRIFTGSGPALTAVRLGE